MQATRHMFPSSRAAPPNSAPTPMAPVWIAWAAPALLAVEGEPLAEPVMEPVAAIVTDEAPLKATVAGMVAVGVTETAVLFGLRTLLGRVG